MKITAEQAKSRTVEALQKYPPERFLAALETAIQAQSERGFGSLKLTRIDDAAALHVFTDGENIRMPLRYFLAVARPKLIEAGFTVCNCMAINYLEIRWYEENQ